MISINQRLKKKSQRGSVTSIVVLLIAFVVTLALISTIEISDTGMVDTMNQSDSVSALFLAESGLEYTMYQLANGTACGGLAATQNLGKGSFTTSAGVTTDFDGVTALPAGQCRIQSIGTTNNSAMGMTSRTVQAIVSSSAGGAIAYDSAGSSIGNNKSSITWTHTTGIGVNRMLIVGVAFENSGGITLSNITYNGVALASTTAISNGTLTIVQQYLLNPPSGAFTVNVTLSAKTGVVAGSVSLSNVRQVAPEVTVTQSGSSATASRSITPLTNNAWVIDVVARNTDSSLTVLGGSQSQRWNDTSGGNPANRIRAAASTAGPVSSATNMQWTLGGGASNWGMVVSGVAPSGGTSQILAWREKN